MAVQRWPSVAGVLVTDGPVSGVVFEEYGGGDDVEGGGFEEGGFGVGEFVFDGGGGGDGVEGLLEGSDGAGGDSAGVEPGEVLGFLAGQFGEGLGVGVADGPVGDGVFGFDGLLEEDGADGDVDLLLFERGWSMVSMPQVSQLAASMVLSWSLRSATSLAWAAGMGSLVVRVMRGIDGDEHALGDVGGVECFEGDADAVVDAAVGAFDVADDVEALPVGGFQVGKVSEHGVAEEVGEGGVARCLFRRARRRRG